MNWVIFLDRTRRECEGVVTGVMRVALFDSLGGEVIRIVSLSKSTLEPLFRRYLANGS